MLGPIKFHVMLRFNFLLVIFSNFFFFLGVSSYSCGQATATDALPWWSDADRNEILLDLDRTTKALLAEIGELSQAQWEFREEPSRWNIGEIVEHLEMQNQLHFRELSVTSKAPQYVKFRSITKGRDDYFSHFASDTAQGVAQWFLEPLGRFPTREKGKEAFLRARSNLMKFVRETNVDLRKQFTFRVPVEGVKLSDIKIGEVRDLHQLLLTGIAHTDRHIAQIRKIKRNAGFPLNNR